MRLAILLAGFLAGASLIVQAGPGSLDPSFGTGGRQAYDFTGDIVGTEGDDLLLLPDGRSMLLSVQTNNSNAPRGYLSRHNIDGSLDTSFGTAGKATLPAPCDPCWAYPFAVARFTDGRLVVAGAIFHPVANEVARTTTYLQRYSADGLPDTTFGTNGTVLFEPEAMTHALDMAVGPGDRIALAGRIGPGTVLPPPPVSFNEPPRIDPGSWFVALLDSAGTPLATFDGDGVRKESTLSVGSAARKVLFHPDGRIVALGDDGPSGIFLGAYTLDGAGSAARRIAFFPSSGSRDFVSDLELHADGRLWIGLSRVYDGNPEPFGLVVRLTANGDLDPTFEPVQTGLPSYPTPVSLPGGGPQITPLPSGGALVATSRSPAMTAIYRIRDAFGEIDYTWADSGRIHLNNLFANEMLRQGDGRVIGAGAQVEPFQANPLRALLYRVDLQHTAFVSLEWLRWPTQSLGTRSHPFMTSVLVTNTSGTTATISATASTNFTVTPECGPLGPGATCRLYVRFAPVSINAPFGFLGEEGGTLSITSSAGQGATVVLRGIAEHSLVNHFYLNILGRFPEPAGGNFWNTEARRVRALMQEISGSTQVNTSEAWYAMAQALFGSHEYRSKVGGDGRFVMDLYATFFDRGADGEGLQYWSNELAQGATRDALIAAFMFSAEFLARTEQSFKAAPNRPEIDVAFDLYRGFLSRLPDDGGLRYWVGRLQQAQCAGAAAVYREVRVLSELFGGSEEYAARARSNADYVSDLYNAFMRRGADRPGLQYWVQRLADGSIDRRGVREQFMLSPEFSARVQAIIAAGCKG